MRCFLFIAALLIAGCGILRGDDKSTSYSNTSVTARLNVSVKPDTEVVHFVRDNIDPDVVTKIYVLKHADPYELRWYLTTLVQSRKVDSSNTGIQAIQFNDGTRMLMVSAENYRFDDFANGESLDKIIETIDRPGIASITGKPVYSYFPKYRSAAELLPMVEEIGAASKDDATENIGGRDYLRQDPSLNVIMMRTAPFSRKNIENVLKEYDTPYPEVRAKITIYEIYAENDAKMGLDFQSWKNNDGIDLFNAGGRFMYNSLPDGSSLAKGAAWSDTKYFNFNPKWNTKYVDFLASKGKAKVLHTCDLAVRNNTTASIDRTTQILYAKATPIEGSEYTAKYIYLPDVHFTDTRERGSFEVIARDMNGETIEIVMDNGRSATLTVLQISKGNELATSYQMQLQKGHFVVNGVNKGNEINARTVRVVFYRSDEMGNLLAQDVEFQTNSIPLEKGNRITFEPSNEFGFRMKLSPSITENATILNVQISNSSLIGYQSSGQPRIQKSAEINSKFMISNTGTKLVIGGIDKRDVVRVSNGLPILKDIPFLGWLFSTESESTKRSQLLVVAEIMPFHIRAKLSDNEADSIRKIEEKLKKAGEVNSWGYRQFFLDPERFPRGK